MIGRIASREALVAAPKITCTPSFSIRRRANSWNFALSNCGSYSMISSLRPRMPPAALISSTARCAPCTFGMVKIAMSPE